MGKLTGQTIADSYDQLLIVDHADGISSSLQAIESADTGGSASSLKISTSKVEVIPASDSTSLFEVSKADGTAVLSVDTTNARVGIGTAAPSRLLDLETTNSGGSTLMSLVSATDGNCQLLFGDTSADTQGKVFYNNDGDYMSFTANSSEAMRIESDGKVGIGNTSPDGTLHVEASDMVAYFTATENYDAGVSGPKLLGQGNDGSGNGGTKRNLGYILFTSQGSNQGEMRFAVRNSSGAVEDKMVIDDAGQVGIGIASPSQPFYVSANKSGGWAAYFYNDGNDTDRSGIAIQSGEDSSSGTNYYVHCRDGDGGDVGYLKDVGGTFSAADSSDIRLKENVIDTVIDGLDTVNDIKVRDFDWKKSGNHLVCGLVANELKEVYPQAVDGEPNAVYADEIDDEGNIVVEGGIKPMTIQRDVLVPLLIKAIQELSAKVEALENA